MNTYEISTPKGTEYITAASRKAAVLKLTGMREKAAIATGQITKVKKVG